MITLYSHEAGPSGWKVAIVLEELGLPYETKYLALEKGEQKAREFTALNPNGRIPAIIDHENDEFTLWETNAIIQYLVERYDKSNKIHYSAPSAEYYEIAQWMAFQISGQAPYFGQAIWFIRRHPEKIQSAIERYQNEIDRVISVLDSVLSTRKYLVGDRVTIADLAFITWNKSLSLLLANNSTIDIGKYVYFQRWHDELCSRSSVEKVYAEREKVMAAAAATKS